MWDLYYEHQNKKLRYGNLYLMMVGSGYLAIWLSVVLFAVAPGLVNSSFFKKHTEIRGFLADSDDAWLNPFYLIFNLHLAHHQNPKIPWVHLPKVIRSGAGRISFFRNYLRLWKGPRLTNEKSPKEH
jgi:hypothetical protein